MSADPTATPPPGGAQQVMVAHGPGDFDPVCPGCTTGSHQDGDPRHRAINVRAEVQTVTLGDGRTANALVPVDESWHFDCHAAVGCSHCAEMLEHHDGSVKGKTGQLEVPPQFADGIPPHEFTSGDSGALVRVAPAGSPAPEEG